MCNLIVNPPRQVRLNDRSWPPAVHPACRVSWAICGGSSRDSLSISGSSIVIGAPAADSETIPSDTGRPSLDGTRRVDRTDRQRCSLLNRVFGADFVRLAGWCCSLVNRLGSTSTVLDV